MDVDLRRVTRSSRNKNAKYRDLSGSDSESEQSDYEKGERVLRTTNENESESDSEDELIDDFIKRSNNTTPQYLGRRISKNFDGKDYVGIVTSTDVITVGKNKGKPLYRVLYFDGDSEDLFQEEVEDYLLPPDDEEAATNDSTTTSASTAGKSRKKSTKKEFFKLTGRKKYLLLDVETTGSKRNWDRVLVFAWLVVNEDGVLEDSRTFWVHPGKVRIKPAAYRVHGISYTDMKDKDDFNKIGPVMTAWLQSHLTAVDTDTGVLVSHNGSTDFQFLCKEYAKHGLKLPAKMTHTFDTLQVIRRFSSLAYRKASVSEWTERTKKGKPSYSVNACATYALQQRATPTDFESECGEHHDAMADAMGIYVILFDKAELGVKGLQHLLEMQKRPLFQKLQPVWDAMVEKLKEPPLVMNDVPKGWVEAKVDRTSLETSTEVLPDDIEPVAEPVYTGMGARDPGGASKHMRRHLHKAGVHCGHRQQPKDTSATGLLTSIFLFFFTMPLLLRICVCTNAHATMPIVKEQVREDSHEIPHSQTWRNCNRSKVSRMANPLAR